MDSTYKFHGTGLSSTSLDCVTTVDFPSGDMPLRIALNGPYEAG
jgi:hypothetical protein